MKNLSFVYKPSKNFIKYFLPPVFLDIIRFLFKSKFISYKKVSDWDEAVRLSDGYDANAVIEKVRAATKNVVSGRYAYERDSVVYTDIQYSWQLLAGLILVAENCGRLNVIDFGGSFGSTFRQNKKFIDVLRCDIKWHVVEQCSFVAHGNSDFSTENLKFYESIEGAACNGCDVVLFASVLGYLENPYQIISQVLALAPAFIIFDRTAVSNVEKVLIQSVPERIYKASYPLRILTLNKIIDTLSSHYSLVERWDCEMQGNSHGTLIGCIFKKI